jgi:hypothetical protein
MNTYARIAGGVVAEIVTTGCNRSTLYHPGLTWMDVTGKTCAVGDLVKGAAFTPAPPPAAPALPTVAELQAELAKLAARIDRICRQDC